MKNFERESSFIAVNMGYKNKEKENNHMIDWMFIDIIQMFIYLAKDGIGRQDLLYGNNSFPLMINDLVILFYDK
jgi:hypothetical protein